ncbi:MAG: hypothetical protein K9J37_06355 [Saprospiraceae bacterium]|nr:hypothetical protein [Saprospiraceae bacterium]MCF8249514.1 hypothetical protein [Saprospiraceae bacterium]MCF8280139.1 hypothetical protein [Bacteroidales bacterium]MCF8310732.1 hypothetical protein [Saprospiraceae bacterium]MCF8439437.1 hypothetical protein [Saprospiraceae bacterium]
MDFLQRAKLDFYLAKLGKVDASKLANRKAPKWTSVVRPAGANADRTAEVHFGSADIAKLGSNFSWYRFN